MAINLRLSPELDEQLTEISAIENQSKQQVLVSLIEERWNQIQSRRVASAKLAEIYNERAQLMDRLGDA